MITTHAVPQRPFNAEHTFWHVFNGILCRKELEGACGARMTLARPEVGKVKRFHLKLKPRHVNPGHMQALSLWAGKRSGCQQSSVGC